jgi:hypothetical protein
MSQGFLRNSRVSSEPYSSLTKAKRPASKLSPQTKPPIWEAFNLFGAQDYLASIVLDTCRGSGDLPKSFCMVLSLGVPGFPLGLLVPPNYDHDFLLHQPPNPTSPGLRQLLLRRPGILHAAVQVGLHDRLRVSWILEP